MQPVLEMIDHSTFTPFTTAGGHNGNGSSPSEQGLLGTLIELLVADKVGFRADTPLALTPTRTLAKTGQPKNETANSHPAEDTLPT